MVHCFKTAGLYQCNLKFLLEITSYSLGGYFKELWTTSDSGEYVKILQETELVYVLAAINLYGEKKKRGGGKGGKKREQNRPSHWCDSVHAWCDEDNAINLD